jgi:3-deoxy-D-manno-octulosonic-acid transferase
MGPHTFNFSEAAQLALEAGAARRVASMEEGVRMAARWRAIRRQSRPRQRPANISRCHRGAARKTAEAIVTLLEHR